MSKQATLRLLAFAALTAAVCAPFVTPAQISAQSPYKVIEKWKIGGDGGWDYLTADSAAHKLYISRGPQVLVVDTTTGKQIGAITGLHGTHGIALDDTGKFGYITDAGTANTVVVFDRNTLATVATIPTGGKGPDGIIFEPFTKTVWAFEGHSKDAAVIDTATQKLVATVPLPGGPEFAAADGKGMIYNNLEDKSAIVRIDARTKSVTANWPLTGCEGPSGLAIDADGSHLFPVCDKHMAVVDTASGKTIANPTIGDGPDAAGFDRAHKLAFASCGEGVLSVVDASKPDFPTIETLPTQRGARTMAYDPATDRIYTVTAEFGPRPAATTENPHPRPAILPGSFTVIVIGR
jgi:DNA-binding beta-propeller fold protein YncE